MSIPPKLKDYKLKPLQRFYRPYFSPHTDSYEMDYAFGPTQIYLACININTKYLFMIPVDNRNRDETYNCILQLDDNIKKEFPGSSIQNLRGDADSAFGKIVDVEAKSFPGLEKPKDVVIGNMRYRYNVFTKYMQDQNKVLFLSNSPFTNKNRVIDRAIRTIRDRLGEDHLLLDNPTIVAEAVDEYNNTPHSAFNFEFTPKQVQSDHELEEYYIRLQMTRLDEVKEILQEEGFFNYKSGNILLIHLDFSKTKEALHKKRRAFNRLAVFVGYMNGNVRCKLLERYEGRIVTYSGKEIVIPIFYTRFAAHSIDEIPNKYKQLIL